VRTRLFVDNCSAGTTADSLGQLFKGAGKVEAVSILGDTRRGDVHAFVVMATLGEAVVAIQMFNGTDWNGKSLTVTKASSATGIGGFGGGTTRLERRNR
jgi:cold-inducible RNA-binding protein